MGYIRESFLDIGIANIENDVILENEVSLGRWIADATLLLFSENESCDFKKQLYVQELEINYIPDFYLGKGLKALDIHGRTVIQLKNNLLFETEISQSNILNYLANNNLVDNIFVIYLHRGESVGDISSDNNIQYIHGDSFVNRIKNAINAGKGDVISKLQDKTHTWRKTREERIVKAINDYNRYNSVLFLGAGVSVSANFPDWKCLLKKLIQNEDGIKASDFEEIYNEMACSNLMTARYIQKGLSSSNSFSLTERLRTIFYSHNKNYESKLVSEICNLILKQNKVRSAITYNYDTIIEEALRLKGKRCFSVYKNNRDEENSFPIYHVHGVVFSEVKSNQAEELILSEEDYHRVYAEAFDWSNVEQLHALTRCTCFFIGLSMKDPNLRRLLEIAKINSGNAMRHYVFLERKSFSKDESKSEIDYQIRENIMADLGLNVIWYKGDDNHKELPELLKRFTSPKSNKNL